MNDGRNLSSPWNVSPVEELAAESEREYLAGEFSAGAVRADNPHTPGTPAFDDTIVGEIKTFSGLYVKPMAMTADMFSIVDIAHALARICRYGGHCAGFLSVAEHSIIVSRKVPAEFALDGLLHDRMEAYLGDVCRPLKRLPEMQFYRDAEENGERVSAMVFGVQHPMPPQVKEADHQAFMWEVEIARDDPKLRMRPEEAERKFLARYEQLTRRRIN